MSALSLVAQAARLGPAGRAWLAAALATLTPPERAALWYRWPFWARGAQLAPPGDWHTWLVLAGRGFGKTRAMSEWVIGEVQAGRARRVALVGATAADVRDTMVRGESGILACSPPWFRPLYEPSKRLLTWPGDVAIATCYSSEEPDRLRGPQHDLAWCDELAAWENLIETWDNLLMGLRLGAQPRVGIATTPRALQILRDMQRDPDVAITGGDTWANAANLAASFVKRLKRYEGTELGRQELYAEVLDDRKGAMFSGAWFQRQLTEPELRRVIVAIDPAITTEHYSDETGIVVVGAGHDEKAYVLADSTARLTPDQWTRRAVDTFDAHGADAFVVERNRGGDLLKSILRSTLQKMGKREYEYPIHEVNATKGKGIRAEPIAALYEQGSVVHVGPASRFADLEQELVTWDPSLAKAKKSKSPNRLDALVWGITFLQLGPAATDWRGFEEANGIGRREPRGAARENLGEIRGNWFHARDDDDDEGGGGGGQTIG